MIGWQHHLLCGLALVWVSACAEGLQSRPDAPADRPDAPGEVLDVPAEMDDMHVQTTHLERLRPQFHFSPLEGWLNDPNGLVYYRGQYHLFYQHFPDLPVWGPMHWGHAVSDDLLHWRSLPIALFPDDEAGMAFSGSGLVDWGHVSGLGGTGQSPLLLYFTRAGGNDGAQKQALAWSVDGESFAGYPGNPVVANPGKKDFRDPKVIRYEPSGHWVMVVAGGTTVDFYRSTDLLTWQAASEFQAPVGPDDVVECPDLFPLVDGNGETTWVLVFGVVDGAPAGGSGTRYLLGRFDGQDFVAEHGVEEPLWLDHGPDFYAVQSWSDEPQQRRLVLGWLNNWQYALKAPSGDWRGVMSVPRELALADGPAGPVLVQHPVVELESLRGSVVLAGNPSADDGTTLLVEDAPTELDLSCRLVADGADQVSLLLLSDSEHATRIDYDVANGALALNREASGEVGFDADFAGRYSVPVAAEGGTLQLRILVDRSTVEVFAENGRQVLSATVFPPAGATKLVLAAQGGAGHAEDLVVHSMRSVW